MLFGCNFVKQKEKKKTAVYTVSRLSQPMNPDGNWNKSQWRDIETVKICNQMGDKPLSTPKVMAKMMYDDENLYVIYKVKERYAHCKVTDINGPVWEESAVEFFFTPDSEFPGRYFNLEINCGGTPLMHFNDFSADTHEPLDVEDIKKVVIAHSLPQVVDPEITKFKTWTLEFKMPLKMLEKYSGIDHPEPGAEWRANFYKIAEKGSNIHFLTWSVIDNPLPKFHLPQFFGTIKFN